MEAKTLTGELNVARRYFESKKTSNNLDSYGKSLFATHLKKSLPPEFQDPKDFKGNLEAKLKRYFDFRNFFEEVTKDLPLSDPFYKAYMDNVDLYFEKLYKELGL